MAMLSTLMLGWWELLFYVCHLVLVRFQPAIDCVKHEYRGFITLKDNFKDNLTDFEPYDPSIGDKDFRQFLEEIKEKGDEFAHTLEIIPDLNEINRLKPSINKYSYLLTRVTQKIREKQTTGMTAD
jgi:hypothetical protein